MLIFDRIRLQDLDRRNWQLWALAIGMILVLAGGLALHMYTLASTLGVLGQPARHAARNYRLLRARHPFRGLLDRPPNGDCAPAQGVERREKAQPGTAHPREQGTACKTLFGPGQFCDRLALELQRAANSKLPLSGLTISLEVSPNLSDTEEIYSAFGEAVKAMMNKLRGEDSIYQFTSGVFGILLPGAGADAARSVAVRVADGLNEAMGISKRYSFDIRITNFPDHAKTAPEMEKLMRMTRAG